MDMFPGWMRWIGWARASAKEDLDLSQITGSKVPVSVCIYLADILPGEVS